MQSRQVMLEQHVFQEAHLQTLMPNFDSLMMMESDSIDEYAEKLSGITSKAITVSETIEEPKLVKKFLKTLL